MPRRNDRSRTRSDREEGLRDAIQVGPVEHSYSTHGVERSLHIIKCLRLVRLTFRLCFSIPIEHLAANGESMVDPSGLLYED